MFHKKKRQRKRQEGERRTTGWIRELASDIPEESGWKVKITYSLSLQEWKFGLVYENYRGTEFS